MNEIEIELSEVNPQDFFGEQNKTIEHLRAYFPKIKIIARGNKLKALGEEEILEEFVKHRKDVVTKRTKFDLRKAKERGGNPSLPYAGGSL